MSALLENSVYVYKAKIDKNTCSFFKPLGKYNDMDHTHMVRVRMRVWNEVINCVRYQCTLDWYIDRYMVAEDDEDSEAESLKNQESLILRILCRAAPSVKTFNKEHFIGDVNQQYQNSKVINLVKDNYSK
jgi:hypothetical protein